MAGNITLNPSGDGSFWWRLNPLDGGLIGFLTGIFILRVRNYDHFPENLIQLVSTSLLVPSPLDEGVQAQTLDDLAGILPGGFP